MALSKAVALSLLPTECRTSLLHLGYILISNFARSTGSKSAKSDFTRQGNFIQFCQCNHLFDLQFINIYICILCCVSHPKPHHHQYIWSTMVKSCINASCNLFTNNKLLSPFLSNINIITIHKHRFHAPKHEADPCQSPIQHGHQLKKPLWMFMHMESLPDTTPCSYL